MKKHQNAFDFNRFLDKTSRKEQKSLEVSRKKAYLCGVEDSFLAIRAESRGGRTPPPIFRKRPPRRETAFVLSAVSLNELLHEVLVDKHHSLDKEQAATLEDNNLDG